MRINSELLDAQLFHVTSRLAGTVDLTLLYLGIALRDNVSSIHVSNLISGYLNFINTGLCVDLWGGNHLTQQPACCSPPKPLYPFTHPLLPQIESCH